MIKFNVFIFALLILVVVTSIRIVLAINSPLGLTPKEAEAAYLTRSIPLIFTPDGQPILNFTMENGYLLFPAQIIVLFPFVNVTGIAELAVRLPAIFFGFLSITILLWVIYSQNKQNRTFKIFFVLATFLFTLSPWLNTLGFFHLPEILSFFTASLLIFFLSRAIEKNYLSTRLILYLFLLLFLGALTSWTGLFFALSAPLFLFFLIKNNFGKSLLLSFAAWSLILLYLPITFMLLANKNYVQESLLKNTLLEKLTPSVLEEEINERQAVDYLATNKEFMLPELTRKLIYNKPLLATNKIISKTVGIFDFEQFASPLASYDIVKLSGILPKGILPLGYIWDIPLLIAGIFLLVKTGSKKNPWMFYLLVPAFLPALIFEKRELTTSGSLLLPIILFAEARGIAWIAPLFRKIRRITLNLILLFATVFIFVGIFNFFTLFFHNEERYRPSHYYFFQQIAKWLKQNRSQYQKAVITTRFGSTHLVSAYYLNIPPRNFWPVFFSPEIIVQGKEKIEVVKLENLEFRQISLPLEQITPNMVYIGFPGEFLEPRNLFDPQKIPGNLTFIGKITAPDELVKDFGENLWIIKSY